MLTPSKIMNHHFEVAGKNAYRAHSVDEFFDIVAENYEQMFKENGDLVKKISILAERLDEYKNDEDNIRNALLTAQRTADRIVKETEQQAAATKAEADEYAKNQETTSNEKAQKLLDDARARASEIIDKANRHAADIIRNATAEAKEQEVVARDHMIKAQAGLDLIEKEADKFKRELLTLYSEHIEIINKIPEVEGSDEAVAVVEAVEAPAQAEIEPATEAPALESAQPEAQEAEVQDEAAWEEETEAEPVEEEAEDDAEISVEDYLNKYTDEDSDDYTQPQAEYEDEPEEETYEYEEQGAEEPEEEKRPSLTDIFETIDGEQVIDEPREEDDYDMEFGGNAFEEEEAEESDYEPEVGGDTFKFDLSSFKFGEENGADDDEDEDEYYDDDDDDDDDYFDDDEDDKPSGKGGFAAKFKGFFKR